MGVLKARPKPSRFSMSLARGLEILAAFTPSTPVLGIADLAESLHMSRATVHRYAQTLLGLGYLEQDYATRKYRPAMKVVDLGMSAINSMDLSAVAAPRIQALSTRFGLTANMAVLDGVDIVYIDRAAAPTGVNLDLHVGSRLPAYCTSMGKALLAYLPPDDVAKRFRHFEFAKRGPNTVTSVRSLVTELRAVREIGFAVNNEELAYGLRSIAAPVRGSSGAVIAAINLAVHATRFTTNQLVDTYARVVVATALEISRLLGYRPPAAAAPGSHRGTTPRTTPVRTRSRTASR